MKSKIKSYEFWVSIVSAVMVVLQSLSIKFNLPIVQETVMGFLGILALAGIVKKKQSPQDDASIEDSTESQSIDNISSKEEDRATDDSQEKDNNN